MKERKDKELWDPSILLTASLQSKHGIRQGPLLYKLYSNREYINFSVNKQVLTLGQDPRPHGLNIPVPRAQGISINKNE